MDASNRFFEYRPAAHFLVTDEDAADFLQSQFSNELRPFRPGQCTYGLWLNVKGKVLADSVILCEGEERFRVLSEGSEGTVIAAHMERHIIADDVAIEHLDAGLAFELSGDGCEAILKMLNVELPACGECTRTAQGIVYSIRANIYHLLVESKEVGASVRTALLDAGFSELTEDARGLARLEAGIPLVPVEIGPEDLPGEGGLERAAISFTKGCYLGQEVVARMHNIGKPQRGLFLVEGALELPELACALYNSDDKAVGELRTAYPVEGGWRGVAILKTRFAQAGDVLRFGERELVVLKAFREGIADD